MKDPVERFSKTLDLYHIATAELVDSNKIKLLPTNAEILEELIEYINTQAPKFQNEYQLYIEKKFELEDSKPIYLLEIKTRSQKINQDRYDLEVKKFVSHFSNIVEDYRQKHPKRK